MDGVYINYWVGAFIVIYWFFCTWIWFNRVAAVISEHSRHLGSLAVEPCRKPGENPALHYTLAGLPHY